MKQVKSENRNRRASETVDHSVRFAPLTLVLTVEW